MSYEGQHKQDLFIDTVVFNQKRGGTFIEIGAYNGIGFSNTYFFEKDRGWKGICIEPIPERFEKLSENRSCICINGCISNESGKRKFTWAEGNAEMLSGLTSKYDEEHLKRIDRELAEYGGEKHEIDVDCFKLDELMIKYGMQHVDYCSIDVEGAEFDILNSVDFKDIDITSFTVENNYDDPAIRKLMRKRGYSFIGKLVCDDIYIKTRNFIETAHLRLKLKNFKKEHNI